MMKYKNPYSQQAYDIIMPLVGDLMTQNILKIQSHHIGKTEETLSKDDIPKLALSIKSGLTIFVGSVAADTISSKILSIH
jgi:hypothetical protein